MNRRAIAFLFLAIFAAIVLGLLLGPCVLTSTPVEPLPDPAVADDTAAADVTG